MIKKNTAGQGVYVYAHDTAADAAKTGDAANITATVSKDGAAPAAVADTNPTEIGGGVYWFDLSQAETNADRLAVVPVSATTDVQLDPVLAETITPADYVASTVGLTAAGVDAVLDEVVEGSTTFRQLLRLFAAVLFGKASGGGTTAVSFRDLADTKDRVSATVDTDGNRTAVTLDGA